MVELVPGNVSFDQLRAIGAGAPATLDQASRTRVKAGADAVSRILTRGAAVYGINTGFGKLASVRIGDDALAELQRNVVLSHAAGVGAPTPAPVVRLMLALKLASLGHGASGIRIETVRMLEAMLSADALPIVPCQGSVGASGDLAPLAHMAAAMIGVGQISLAGEIMDASDALARVGLTPLVLGPKEGLALLNGTQFSTANAIVALLDTEALFQTALVTGALSTEAARGADTPFDPRIHQLRRHRGQIETAEALMRLMAGSEIRASHRNNDTRVQDPYCLRCQPQVMGAVFDILQHVARVLLVEANGVSDNPLIFADTDEALSGGNFHAQATAFSADILALAICEIGSIAERRIAMLVDPALSGLPPFLTSDPGLNSGFMIPQVTAAALVAENKQCAHPASIDSIPTSANQEDHVSMAAHAARRLHTMNENLAAILAIEALAATQGIAFHGMLATSEPLSRVCVRMREHVPALGKDRYLHPDIATAGALVRNRTLIEAAGLPLPAVA